MVLLARKMNRLKPRRAPVSARGALRNDLDRLNLAIEALVERFTVTLALAGEEDLGMAIIEDFHARIDAARNFDELMDATDYGYEIMERELQRLHLELFGSDAAMAAPPACFSGEPEPAPSTGANGPSA
ncbi:MAG: hypothetical protein KDG54_19285, partial [Geminicoccaceae bacterium]|nr:hypothetical protein [Geminicoccaceae bacterium]